MKFIMPLITILLSIAALAHADGLRRSSSVNTETIKVPAWKCGGPSTALVYSPTKPGKFPIISFAQGWTAGGSSVP